MPPRPLAPFLILSLLATGAGSAEEIRSLEVTNEHGRYRVSFDAVLAAPAAKTRPYMIEPRQWPRLSEIISDARVLERLDDDRQKVHVTFKACVLFYCKTVQKVEEMRRLADGDIVTLALPEDSDFDYAHERWRISGDAHHTRVQYEAELVPSFFVPPVIGPYILKSELEGLLTETARNLERLARDDGTDPIATD